MGSTLVIIASLYIPPHIPFAIYLLIMMPKNCHLFPLLETIGFPSLRVLILDTQPDPYHQELIKAQLWGEYIEIFIIKAMITLQGSLPAG